MTDWHSPNCQLIKATHFLSSWIVLLTLVSSINTSEIIIMMLFFLVTTLSTLTQIILYWVFQYAPALAMYILLCVYVVIQLAVESSACCPCFVSHISTCYPQWLSVWGCILLTPSLGPRNSLHCIISGLNHSLLWQAATWMQPHTGILCPHCCLWKLCLGFQ